ncbi:MAG: DUF2188 domain-containing protein [Ignavibacteria bacterium]|nr:DUF2188 domain-containing protein [Ignavibacteria bacterium]
MKQTQRVTPREDGWAVVGEGAKRATSVHKTKSETLARAKEIAAKKKSEVVLHFSPSQRPVGKVI